MLVLTRKPNQQLHIGNDIVITVVKVRGNTIRLGIEAPKDVRVIRSELEPKPASGATRSDSLASARDDQADAQPEADAAADDAHEAAAVELRSEEPVIIQARIKPQAANASPLKRFGTATRSQGTHAERNLEDCPLCHRAPQDSSSVALRPGGLHSYIASKNRSGALEPTAPRGQQAASKQPKCAKDQSGASAVIVQA